MCAEEGVAADDEGMEMEGKGDVEGKCYTADKVEEMIE
jgi:hypothetical protein